MSVRQNMYLRRLYFGSISSGFYLEIVPRIKRPLLLAQGVKGWQAESLAHPLMKYPCQELSRLRCKTLCTQLLAPRDSSSRKPERKMKKPREKAGNPDWERVEQDTSGRTMEPSPRHLHPLRKCIAPGRDVPGIPSPWFNHLVTEMKTNSFGCSDPTWAFGGGNPSTDAEVRTLLPVIPQAESLTARICSAARKDNLGNTL